MNILNTGTNSGFGRDMAVLHTQTEHTTCTAMRCLNGINEASAAAFVELSDCLDVLNNTDGYLCSIQVEK